jgi:subtilisin family serine protease
MSALEAVRLTALMARSSGSPRVNIGLIDGPVFIKHPDFANTRIRPVGTAASVCAVAHSIACRHGTFVAGILFGTRSSAAPAICPNCTLLVRPIFAETGGEATPSTTAPELAGALIDCIDMGAHVINLSLAIGKPSRKGEQALEEALNLAARRAVIIIAAAGNQSTLTSSVITRHPWVLPVVACDVSGRPMNESNLGGSIGRRGVSAPGEHVRSLGVEGQSLMKFEGTSVAAPFVTGTAALLWSEFPTATAAAIKTAITFGAAVRRRSIAPPLLNAASAHESLLQSRREAG